MTQGNDEISMGIWEGVMNECQQKAKRNRKMSIKKPQKKSTGVPRDGSIGRPPSSA